MNRWQRSLTSGIGLGILALFLTAQADADPVAIPAGTELRVKLIDSLSTDVNTSGEAFRAVLESDLRIDGRIVASAGSPVRGRLVLVQRPKRLTRKAKMSVDLTRLDIEEKSYKLSTSVTEFKARRDGSVVTTTTMGAYAGGAAGATAGSLFSDDQDKVKKMAAVGAIAGAVFANKRKHVEFAPGHLLGFLLAESISVELKSEPEPDTPGDILVIRQTKHVLGVTHFTWRYPFIVLPRVFLVYPFWSSLALHGLLTVLVLALVWSRTRGSQTHGSQTSRSETVVRVQLFPRSFWIGFYLISIALVLLLARGAAQEDSFLSWKWLAGGLCSILWSLIAQWIYENFHFSVAKKEDKSPAAQPTEAQAADEPAAKPIDQELPSGDGWDPGSPPPIPTPEPTPEADSGATPSPQPVSAVRPAPHASHGRSPAHRGPHGRPEGYRGRTRPRPSRPH